MRRHRLCRPRKAAALPYPWSVKREGGVAFASPRNGELGPAQLPGAEASRRQPDEQTVFSVAHPCRQLQQLIVRTRMLCHSS